MKLETPTNDSISLIKASTDILKIIYKDGYRYKRSGVVIGDIIPDNQVQINLFDLKNHQIARKELNIVMDKINQSMGRDKVQFLAQGISERLKLKQERLSPCYTTRWEDLLKIS